MTAHQVWSIKHHCAEGNCAPLEGKGVNVDSVGGVEVRKVLSTVPWPGFDRTIYDLDGNIAMNTRQVSPSQVEFDHHF